jgi:hypothetical protein
MIGPPKELTGSADGLIRTPKQLIETPPVAR